MFISLFRTDIAQSKMSEIDSDECFSVKNKICNLFKKKRAHCPHMKTNFYEKKFFKIYMDDT